MNTTLVRLLDALAGRRVAVLGEAMLDSYLEGAVRRFCPEAPVPVVSVGERRDLPGGAANTAVNAHGLGGRVRFLSVVGADPEGDALRLALQERGLSTEHLLTAPGRRTLLKQRFVAASQTLLRLDQGSTGAIEADTEEELLRRLAVLFADCEAVIVSDYAYGIVTPRILRALGDLQARWSGVLVVDSRRLAAFRDVGVTAVKPNCEEAVALLGGRPLEGFRLRADALADYGERILELTGASIAAVTLDSEGALVFEHGRPPHRCYAQACRQACVAGAGDTFTATLALALAGGASTAAAADLATAAAAVVVGKERTAACSAVELRELLCAGGKFVADRAHLAARREFYRQQGRRVVFTNGCFDILHRGHITYLHQARALGDVLIVGVNSDDGIRRLKGPSRPLNPLEDRLQVLAALGCVDHLIAFDEGTPCELIRALKPDVFVKGGDYTRERLPEAPLVEELGGVVHILPFLDNRSTTGLIERIQQARAADGVLVGGRT
jgi:D-beta-D-heptose 7-phosphate kinase/D-beta-D-heptose 1-phosphate adenosyltransferase